jgi:hypothetical protein
MAHAAEERFSIRDGINIVRFALKLRASEETPLDERIALPLAVKTILGNEAMRYIRARV